MISHAMLVMLFLIVSMIDILWLLYTILHCLTILYYTTLFAFMETGHQVDLELARLFLWWNTNVKQFQLKWRVWQLANVYFTRLLLAEIYLSKSVYQSICNAFDWNIILMEHLAFSNWKRNISSFYRSNLSEKIFWIWVFSFVQWHFEEGCF